LLTGLFTLTILITLQQLLKRVRSQRDTRYEKN
jgi:hypothetical protein